MKLEIHYKGSMTEGILAPPHGHFVIMMCSLSKYIIWTDYMKNLGHLRNTKAATGLTVNPSVFLMRLKNIMETHKQRIQVTLI